MHFIQMLRECRPDINVICLIDDAQKNVSAPIPVRQFSGLTTSDYDLILITSAYWVDISRKLEAIGQIKFMVVDSSVLYSYLIFNAEEALAWDNLISQTLLLLTNDNQKALYELLISSRQTPDNQLKLYDYFHTNKARFGREYLEYINTEDLYAIIEGGVFDGTDTLEFVKQLADGGVLYGFDPNLTILSDRLKHAQHPQIKLYTRALWSKKTLLNFFSNSNNLPGARVVNGMHTEEVNQVSAVSIDEFVAEQSIEKVDFIKLDIEGAELEVLRGAKYTLKKHRPQLAICIYHKKEHLFQIPLYLDSLLDNYHFYIGHYSPTFWDTVWYAIPNELLIDDFREKHE